jgi:hypothetical protein
MFTLCGNQTRDLLRSRQVFRPLRQIGRQRPTQQICRRVVLTTLGSHNVSIKSKNTAGVLVGSPVPSGSPTYLLDPPREPVGGVKAFHLREKKLKSSIDLSTHRDRQRGATLFYTMLGYKNITIDTHTQYFLVQSKHL